MVFFKDTLFIWVRKADQQGLSSGQVSESERNRALVKEVNRLKMENELLKKSPKGSYPHQLVLRQRVQVKYAFMAEHKDHDNRWLYPVAVMAKVLEVSVSGFYHYLTR